MTNTDCISLLRRVRDKAAISTTSQLLDYIDGQIDAIESMSSTSSSNVPYAHPRTIVEQTDAPYTNNEQYQNDDLRYEEFYPRQYTKDAPCDNVSTTVARFRGADMD